jgi:microcystin degradation protein MlrC
VFEHYVDLVQEALQGEGALDGLFLALHGALTAEPPHDGGEASLLRSIRRVVGAELPIVATYDFHANYTDWECSALLPVPLDTNPHIDAYERGREAADLLARMLANTIHPVTLRIGVPILGPNIGQSTWSHDPDEEQRLPLFRLNQMRAELEAVPQVLNLAIQGGFGYADVDYAGMSVIATTDGDPELAERMAQRLARELWAVREEIRTVRRVWPIEAGIRSALQHATGPVCLVDLGDDPGSNATADSPVVLDALLQAGVRNSALTIRDRRAVEAAHAAGVGATLTLEVGAEIDQRFYEPVSVTGRVVHLDDGRYEVRGPTHGGWGRETRPEAFRMESVGPRATLRTDDDIDIVFSCRMTGKDQDFFRSAGVEPTTKDVLVVKSNQAHRASFDPIVTANIELDTPGICTVSYTSLPFRSLRRPIFPIDRDMEWAP